MSGTTAGRGPERERDDQRDAGATLVELVVAMGIFTTVLAVFMASVVGFGGLTVKTQNLADATDDVRSAFLLLDRDVRYADAISVPGSVSSDWFVETTTPATASSAVRCAQWRFHAATSSLQVRRWDKGSTPPAAWTDIAGGLAVDPAKAPFVRTPAGSTPSSGPAVPLLKQQVVVHLLASRGAGGHAGATALDTAFVARNSTGASPGNSDTTAATTNLCGTTSSIRTTS